MKYHLFKKERGTGKFFTVISESVNKRYHVIYHTSPPYAAYVNLPKLIPKRVFNGWKGVYNSQINTTCHHVVFDTESEVMEEIILEMI